MATTPATGSLKMAVCTVISFQTTSRGRPTLTETIFMRAVHSLRIWNGLMQDSIDCLCDDRDDSIRRRGKWSVVHFHRKNVASCAMSHESLSLGSDHAISFRHQKPRRLLFPSRFGHLLLYAFNCDRLLRCRHQQSIVCGTLMSDRIGETLRRHPEKRVLIGHKRRSARMRRSAMEEFADSLTFVRRHRRDINKSLHVRVPATGSRDDRAPVGVTHQHHRTAYPLEESS